MKDVWILKDASYYYRLQEELEKAKKSILVIMFVCCLEEDAPPNHPVRKVLDILVAKQKEGVKIKVILDYDDDLLGSVVEFNQNAFDYVKENGIDVSWESPEVKTHTKLVIINEEVILVGAHNWTTNAFFHNNEVSVYIKNKEKARWLLKKLAEDESLNFTGEGFLPPCYVKDSASYTGYGTRYSKEEWKAFYKRNPDFPATDGMLLEVERKAEDKGISLDEAWKEMKKNEPH